MIDNDADGLFIALAERERQELLTRTCGRPVRWNFEKLSDAARETLSLFALLRRTMRCYGPEALGGHVINGSAVPIGVHPDGLYIVDTALPAWESGEEGSYTLTHRGGQGDCAWSVTAGALPGGFRLEGATITGSGTLPPSTTMSMSAPFTITVTCGEESHSVQFALTIVEAPPTLTFHEVEMEAGRDYTVEGDQLKVVEASGGTGPYRYAVDTGCRLPFGVKLDRYTGMLYGNPYEPGEFTKIRLCAIDLVGTATCETLPKLRVKKSEGGDDRCSPPCTGDEVCVSTMSCIPSVFDDTCECAGSTEGTCFDFKAHGINVSTCGDCTPEYTACCPGEMCVNGTCIDTCTCCPFPHR